MAKCRLLLKFKRVLIKEWIENSLTAFNAIATLACFFCPIHLQQVLCFSIFAFKTTRNLLDL